MWIFCVTGGEECSKRLGDDESLPLLHLRHVANLRKAETIEFGTNGAMRKAVRQLLLDSNLQFRFSLASKNSPEYSKVQHFLDALASLAVKLSVL